MVAAISPGRAMEDLSGKNQDATSLDRFALLLCIVCTADRQCPNVKCCKEKEIDG